MMTPEKVERTADGLMKPAVDELKERQQKLERRRQSNARPFTMIMPAAIAAIATAASISFLDFSPVYAAVFGGVMGWTTGSVFSGKR